MLAVLIITIGHATAEIRCTHWGGPDNTGLNGYAIGDLGTGGDDHLAEGRVPIDGCPFGNAQNPTQGGCFDGTDQPRVRAHAHAHAQPPHPATMYPAVSNAKLK